MTKQMCCKSDFEFYLAYQVVIEVLAKSVANWNVSSSFEHFFKFLGNQGELEKTKQSKILVIEGEVSKVKLIGRLF